MHVESSIISLWVAAGGVGLGCFGFDVVLVMLRFTVGLLRLVWEYLRTFDAARVSII